MTAKLFVRNLSWSVAENDLFDLFAEVGPVVSVKIPTRREDGKPRGFAFIEMETQEAGQQAIQRFNGFVFADRDLAVAFQDETRSGAGPSSGEGAPKNSKLFVRNLGYGVTDQALQSLFAQVGTVVSVKVVTDRETGAPKGFGFVEMATADEAQEAIDRLNNTPLEGREIAIDFQDPNRSKRPSGGSSGYSRAGGGGGYGGSRGGSGYSDRW